MDRLNRLQALVRSLHADVVSGAFLLVVAAAYGFAALRIPPGQGEPGPRAIPLLLAVLLAGLSMWTMARGLKRVPVERTASPVPISRTGLAVFATLAYVAFFQPFGFAVTTAAYSAVLAWLFGRDSRALIAGSVAITIGLFVFFRVVLGVRLPTGLFGL